MSDAAKFPAEAPRTAAVPAWITPALIAKTQRVWSPRYGHDLTVDEAVEILGTAGKLCDVLFAPSQGEGNKDEPTVR